MNKPCTIYLADDHQIVIDGLKLLIDGESMMKVVGSATDGETAREEILIKRPDIALIDLTMPRLDGMQLITILRKVATGTKFVVLSMDDTQRSMRDARSYGASGYLLKNAGKTELIKCLTLVLGNETYFPNLRSGKNLLNQSLFTPKETEIIRLVLQNRTTADIAEALSLSPHTITVHRKNIARKTNTKTPLGLQQFLKENSIEF